MIDLRYVERLEPVREYKDLLTAGSSLCKTVRVLQWRIIGPEHCSEWSDVPTVKEPT